MFVAVWEKDLVPSITAAYFSRRIPVQLSSGQAAILLGTGLQQMSDGDLGDLLNLPANQVRALANKALKKIYGVLRGSKESAIERSLPVPKEVKDLSPHEVTVDEDLNEAATEADEYMKSALSLDKVGHFAISADDADLRGAMNGSKIPESGTVSVKSKRRESAESEMPYKRKGRKSEGKGKKKKGRKSV